MAAMSSFQPVLHRYLGDGVGYRWAGKMVMTSSQAQQAAAGQQQSGSEDAIGDVGEVSQLSCRQPANQKRQHKMCCHSRRHALAYL
jgi:hypothetical protein